MSAVMFAGTGSSTGASVIAPCVNRIVPIMIDCANNPGILCNFGITVGVAEIFTAIFANPVFFISILGAGGVFLWNMYILPCVTVNVQEALTPLPSAAVAVIVAVPALMAVTVPSALTVAMLVLLLCQVTS